MPALAKLPKDVCDHLRASTAISSVSQAVDELVCNALDANATVIDVSVCCESGFIDIRDDGVGIRLDDLSRCATRHCTSKVSSLSDLRRARTLGFRGEALASIGDIAVLSLHTRSLRDDFACEKWVKGGTVLSMGTSQNDRAIGTTVTVRDLFWNVPVRRKSLSRDARKEISRTRQILTRSALAHWNVRFSLFDSSKSKKLLQTQRVESALGCFGHLFGTDLAGKLAELQYRLSCDGGATGRLRGLLSRPGQNYHNSSLQFLYVNSRFVRDTLGAKIHQRINAKLKSVSRGPNLQLQQTQQKQAQADASLIGDSRGVISMQYDDALGNFPMFVLELDVDAELADVTYDVDKTTVSFDNEVRVGNLIDDAINHFLAQHDSVRAQRHKRQHQHHNQDQHQHYQQRQHHQQRQAAVVSIDKRSSEQLRSGHQPPLSTSGPTRFAVPANTLCPRGSTESAAHMNRTPPQAGYTDTCEEAAAAPTGACTINRPLITMHD